jgi:hypothetical protein
VITIHSTGNAMITMLTARMISPVQEVRFMTAAALSNE